MGEIKIDSLLKCLVVVLTIHGKAIQENQLKRAYASDGKPLSLTELIRASRELGFRAQQIKAEKNHLKSLPMPFIACMGKNEHIVVVKSQADQIVFYNPYHGLMEQAPMEKLRQEWDGVSILFADDGNTDEVQGIGFSWFVSVLRKYWPQLAKVMLLSVLLQLFGLLSPFFTQIIIDDVLVHNSVSTLDIMVGGMAMVMMFQLILGGFRSYIFTNIANKADAELSARLFKHLMFLQTSFYNNWTSGDVVTRIRELEKVRQFITGTGVTLVLDAIFAVIYMAVMFHYSVDLTIIVLVAVPCYTLLNLAIIPIYRKRLNENFTANAATQSYIIETVTGIETVKHHAVEGLMEKKWESLLNGFVKSNRAIANLVNGVGSVGGLYQQLFMLSILWYGAYLVMENQLSIGQLIAFQMLAGMVVTPVMRIFSAWQSFQQAKVSLDKLGDIMDSPAEATFNPNRSVLPSVRGRLELDNVSFRYSDEGNQVLRHISLSISEGSCVGIVGPSGSGKSTITRLMQLLYTPESGRVLVDGVDMAQMEPAWLRRQIGVVLQESFLFNGTIAENIAAAKPDATEQEIVQVARMAGVMDFLKDMPDGFNTNVGERGGNLSGGQRQRVAIARALITNPKILILDEATSALDYASEHSIMSNLEKFAKGRTVIMIAHRLKTVMKCDKIFVISQGVVAEEGSHEALLERGGLYHSLWMEQQ